MIPAPGFRGVSAADFASRPHPAPLERRRMINAPNPMLAAAEAAIRNGSAQAALDAILSLPEADWQRVLSDAVAPF